MELSTMLLQNVHRKLWGKGPITYPSDEVILLRAGVSLGKMVKLGRPQKCGAVEFLRPRVLQKKMFKSCVQ